MVSPSKPVSSYYDYNPLNSAIVSSLTSPRSGPVRHEAIAARINQLQEICQSKSGYSGPTSTISCRRENSRSGFGRRKNTAFAGPALRNSRLNEEPQIDGTHSYLGTNITRTNHTQEHAIVRAANWEKTAGLHAQMQPTGLVFKANESTKPWAVLLKTNDYSPTIRRKYDRNGNLVPDRSNSTNTEPAPSKSQIEHGHVSKFPSLSTVLESQLIEQEECSLPDEHKISVQPDRSSQTVRVSGTRFSSSNKSMPNATPLSTKKKNVREMYEYYGIKRPTELSSEHGTLETTQPIRVQRNCHVCGWINGPDIKCWKCLHRFCDECDNISPQVFFQTEDSFPLEDLEANINPIKLSLVNIDRQTEQDSIKEKLTKRENTFSLQFPYINVPEPGIAWPPENTDVEQKSPVQNSLTLDAAKPQAPKQNELRKMPKPSTISLRSEYAVDKPKLDQTGDYVLQTTGTALRGRIRESRSSTYHTQPIHIRDIPSRPPVLEKARKKHTAIPKPLQVNLATFPATNSKEIQFNSRQPATLRLSSQATAALKTKHAKLYKGQRKEPTSEMFDNDLKSRAPTDSVFENRSYHKTGAQSSRLRPVDTRLGRNGSHHHRRTRKHTIGSESKSSSLAEHFSCDSPGCLATHAGYQPYRHSISCTRKKNRIAEDTDSGYIASRSHNEDAGGTLLHLQLEPPWPLTHMERRNSTTDTEGQKDWPGRHKVPRERVDKKQPEECLQCYGYLNDCPCSTCQSINRVIMEQEAYPLLPVDEPLDETQVYMPQSPSDGINPKKQLVPVALFQGKSEPGSTSHKTCYEKVKGDMLWKPISIGYEPIPKIPLHTITYAKEETSKLQSVPGAFRPEPEQQSPSINPRFSDLLTPATEKNRQESFFGATNQQLIEKDGARQEGPSDFQANTKRYRNSNRQASLSLAREVRTPLPQTWGLTRDGSSSRRRRSKNTTILHKPGPTRTETSIYCIKSPETVRNSPMQPPPVPFEKEMEATINLGKHNETGPQDRLGETEWELSNASRAQQQNFSSTHSRASSLWKSPPTPASRSLSAILERDTLQLLHQKLEQQQYELERITKLFQGHFAEISQPSGVPSAASIVENRESEKTPEEKDTKKDDAEQRKAPWRINLFDRKPSVKYGEPASPLRNQAMLEQCNANDQEGMGVTSLTKIQAAEIADPHNNENSIAQDTSIPNIILREPTLIPTNANSTFVSEENCGLVTDSKVKRLTKAFSPLGFSLGSPQSSLKAQRMEGEFKEREDGEGKTKRNYSCDCGIMGLTIIIHLEGKEDMVFKADLTTRIR